MSVTRQPDCHSHSPTLKKLTLGHVALTHQHHMSNFGWGYPFENYRKSLSNANEKPIKDDQALRTKLKRMEYNSLPCEESQLTYTTYRS